LAKLRGTYALTLGMPLVESISVMLVFALGEGERHLLWECPSRKYKGLLTFALGKADMHLLWELP